MQDYLNYLLISVDEILATPSNSNAAQVKRKWKPTNVPKKHCDTDWNISSFEGYSGKLDYSLICAFSAN
jgi:pyocin large subunit-like protein